MYDSNVEKTTIVLSSFNKGLESNFIKYKKEELTNLVNKDYYDEEDIVNINSLFYLFKVTNLWFISLNNLSEKELEDIGLKINDSAGISDDNFQSFYLDIINNKQIKPYDFYNRPLQAYEINVNLLIKGYLFLSSLLEDRFYLDLNDFYLFIRPDFHDFKDKYSSYKLVCVKHITEEELCLFKRLTKNNNIEIHDTDAHGSPMVLKIREKEYSIKNRLVNYFSNDKETKYLLEEIITIRLNTLVTSSEESNLTFLFLDDLKYKRSLSLFCCLLVTINKEVLEYFKLEGHYVESWKYLKVVNNFTIVIRLIVRSIYKFSVLKLDYFKDFNESNKDILVFINFLLQHIEFTDYLWSLNVKEQINLVKKINKLQKKFSGDEAVIGIILNYVRYNQEILHEIVDNNLEEDLTEYVKQHIKNLSSTDSLKQPIDLSNLTLKGGWTVKELITPFDLKDEGDYQGHCVGGYSWFVKEKGRIFSFRRTNTRHTVSFTFYPALNTYKVDQSQGKNRISVQEYKLEESSYLETNIKILLDYLNKKAKLLKKDEL